METFIEKTTSGNPDFDLKLSSVDFSDEINPKNRLDGSSFTVGWLLESLRNNDQEFQKLHGFRKVKKVESKNISSGKGWVSRVIRCRIFFSDSVDENDYYSTVMKIPGIDAIKDSDKKIKNRDTEENKTILKFSKIHHFECLFYSTLGPKLDIPLPKIHKTHPWIPFEKEGCLHMEDLSQKSKNFGFFDCINMDKIKEIIKHLAHFHKQILTMNPEIWKGKFKKNRNGFDVIPKIFLDGLEKFKELAKFDREIVHLLEKYKKIGTNEEFLDFAENKSFEEIGIPPLLVHGDLWSSNIMFQIKEDNTVGNNITAFLDWQMVHEGSIMEDVSRMLVHCCDGEIRRQAESFIFEYYYGILKEDLANDNVEIPFTLEQVKKSYEIMFITQLIHPAFMVIILEANMDNSDEEQKKQNLKLIEKGILKALQTLQDVDLLLSKKYKYLFEKYGS